MPCSTRKCPVRLLVLVQDSPLWDASNVKSRRRRRAKTESPEAVADGNVRNGLAYCSKEFERVVSRRVKYYYLFRGEYYTTRYTRYYVWVYYYTATKHCYHYTTTQVGVVQVEAA